MKTTGLTRNPIDKFYTKREIVETCIAMIKKHIYIQNTDYIIEPSAGNGAFLSEIKTLTSNYFFYDIEPEHEEIIQQDYLSLHLPNLVLENNKNKNNKIHVIGNPPFGRQSSLAIQFIKKSCPFSHSISFLLPKSFKKDSMKKTFPLCFHLVFEMDIPEKSFLVNGKEHHVESVFQIWERKEVNREKEIIQKPHGYEFVKKTDYPKPDFAFRRVGFYAGNIDTEYESKNVQSHYFIRFTNYNNDNKQNIIESLKRIHFTHNNTTGPRSIGKQELIREFNNHIHI